jgi:hypothetical protein
MVVVLVDSSDKQRAVSMVELKVVQMVVMKVKLLVV